MHVSEHTFEEITAAVGRCRETVFQFIRNPEKMQASRRRERPKSVIETAHRRMVQISGKENNSDGATKTRFGFPLSVLQVYHFLNADAQLRHQ